MLIFINLLLLSVISVCPVLANSELGHSLATTGWTSGDSIDFADLHLSPGLKDQSASTNQLDNWATNKSIHGGHHDIATNLHGNPVPSLTASQAIGTRAHVLMQDFNLIDKLASFNRERIPPRVVHAKGGGAHGFFEVTHDISRYTKAKFLNGIGKKTPLFVRFSPLGGEYGSADTAVDPIGFAIKASILPFSICFKYGSLFETLVVVHLNLKLKMVPITYINPIIF